MERLVKFEVLGQEYPLYTDAPEEDVHEILQLVKCQLESTNNRSSLLPAKLAVLTSLNIAGKYVRLKREFEDHKRRTRQNMDNLIRKIESKL